MKLGETIEADEGADDLTAELLATTNSPARFVELAFPDITPEKWQRQGQSVAGERATGSLEGGAGCNLLGERYRKKHADVLGHFVELDDFRANFGRCNRR